MKPTKRRNRKYPRPYVDEIDTGSRTADGGMIITFTLDENGFETRMHVARWTVGDLFGEVGYWPEIMAWAGTAKTLDQLFAELAKANQSPQSKLRAVVTEYYEDHREVNLRAYLAEEKKAQMVEGNTLALWERWPDLHDNEEIPGIPSPMMEKGTCYNGLHLSFQKDGWKAQLFSDAEGDPEVFHPLIWCADTFDGLLEATDDYGTLLLERIPWDRNELADQLIGNDPRWRSFIEPVDSAEARATG